MSPTQSFAESTYWLSRPNYIRLAWTNLALTLLVIQWGAFTRLSGSGDGCGRHWPLCKGALLPASNSLETLIEFSHRLSSGAVFTFTILLFFTARRLFEPAHLARRAAYWAALLMLIEVLIGAKLVLFGWVDQEQSIERIVVLAIHLINTFLLVSALAVSCKAAAIVDCIDGKKINGKPSRVAPALLIICFILLCLSGISGTIASLAHNFYPPISLAQGLAQDFDRMAPWLVRLRILHPALALITSAVLIVTAVLLRHNADKLPLRLLISLVFGQMLLGVVTLVTFGPTALVLLHLLFADLIVISLSLCAVPFLLQANFQLS